MLIKAILGFLFIFLLLLSLPSGARLFVMAGGTKILLLKIAGCSIIALLALVSLVIIF